jgi:uncharacterized DUF497 family protein
MAKYRKRPPFVYTSRVYWSVTLLWDKGNRKHITRHGVSVQEIEEVFRGPYVEPFVSEEQDDEE